MKPLLFLFPDGWDEAAVGEETATTTSCAKGSTSSAFARFEYPSRLPPEAQARACDVALRAMRAVGFHHGCFNVELFWERASGRMRVVDINPRLAAQFGELYWNVDGTHRTACLPASRRVAPRDSPAGRVRSQSPQASCCARSTMR